MEKTDSKLGCFRSSTSEKKELGVRMLWILDFGETALLLDIFWPVDSRNSDVDVVLILYPLVIIINIV